MQKQITEIELTALDDNLRECPSCQKQTLSGMPGGKDAICENCGYKDPCCYD